MRPFSGKAPAAVEGKPVHAVRTAARLPGIVVRCAVALAAAALGFIGLRAGRKKNLHPGRPPARKNATKENP